MYASVVYRHHILSVIFLRKAPKYRIFLYISLNLNYSNLWIVINWYFYKLRYKYFISVSVPQSDFHLHFIDTHINF